MGRGGQHKDRESGPERKCLVSGETHPKSELIRFVTGPDGSVVPDVFGKLPGRGYYVRADGDVLEQAVAKKVFSRGAKAPVTVPDNLLAEVDRQMVHRVVTLVSLARKSGHAIAGFEKSKTWLENGRAKVLIQASDGSERGKTKLNTPRDGRFIGWLTADELGLAFGRQTVIHGALASGGLSRLVIEEANRLRGVRKMNGGKSRSEGNKA